MPKIRECGMRYHEETAIDGFLRRLDADWQRGRHVRRLPEELAQVMLANLGRAEDFDEEIEGKVLL